MNYIFCFGFRLCFWLHPNRNAVYWSWPCMTLCSELSAVRAKAVVSKLCVDLRRYVCLHAAITLWTKERRPQPKILVAPELQGTCSNATSGILSIILAHVMNMMNAMRHNSLISRPNASAFTMAESSDFASLFFWQNDGTGVCVVCVAVENRVASLNRTVVVFRSIITQRRRCKELQ